MSSSGKKVLHTFLNIFRGKAVKKELSAGSNQDTCSLDNEKTQGERIPSEGFCKAEDEALSIPSFAPTTQPEQVAPPSGQAEIHHSDSIGGERSDRRYPGLELTPPNAKASHYLEELPIARPVGDWVLANLLQGIEEFHKNEPSCIIPERNRGCSNEELDIVLKHGELFFAASPKRFVLKRWITDEIRRMFDARMRAPLSVSEIYDSLLEFFRTGFFSLSKLHDFLGTSRMFTWDDFITIENRVMHDYNRAVSGQAEIHHSDSKGGEGSDRRYSELELTPPNAKDSHYLKEMPLARPVGDSALAKLLHDIEEFHKGDPGCISPEKNRGCSNEKLDIILKHGELFFAASPKRFVLKRWITDEIRRMFDARMRAPLSVSEIYDSLLEFFRTGFFSLLKLQDFLGTSSMLTWDDFITIENRVMHDYNLAVSGQANEVGTSESSEYETMPIDTLGLSGRVYRSLRRGGIETVGQLLDMSEESLLKLWGLGRTTLFEIKLALREMGLYLKKDEESTSRWNELGRLERQSLSTKKKQHAEEENDVMAAIFASFDLPTKSPDGED